MYDYRSVSDDDFNDFYTFEVFDLKLSGEVFARCSSRDAAEKIVAALNERRLCYLLHRQ
jgi:hypothetical protein